MLENPANLFGLNLMVNDSILSSLGVGSENGVVRFDFGCESHVG